MFLISFFLSFVFLLERVIERINGGRDSPSGGPSPCWPQHLGLGSVRTRSQKFLLGFCHRRQGPIHHPLLLIPGHEQGSWMGRGAARTRMHAHMPALQAVVFLVMAQCQSQFLLDPCVTYKVCAQPSGISEFSKFL